MESDWAETADKMEERPQDEDCEVKDYAETCEECRFCDNTPASPPEGEEGDADRG